MRLGQGEARYLVQVAAVGLGHPCFLNPPSQVLKKDGGPSSTCQYLDLCFQGGSDSCPLRYLWWASVTAGSRHGREGRCREVG